MAQEEFKNRGRGRSRRSDEAEVLFAQKSAFLRRRLQFLNLSCRTGAIPEHISCIPVD